MRKFESSEALFIYRSHPDPALAGEGPNVDGSRNELCVPPTSIVRFLSRGCGIG